MLYQKPGDTLVALMQSWSELDDLEARWLDLTTGLLRYCRDGQPDSDDWADAHPVEDVIVDAQVRTLRLLAVSDEDTARFASREERQKLAALGQDLLNLAGDDASRLVPLLIAHGIASGIDSVHGHQFLTSFRSRIELQIRTDEPFPVQPHDPRPWIHPLAANTRPSRLARRELDAVPHLRLGTSRSDAYRLVLDFDCWFHLSPLGDVRDLKIAALQPNATLSEFDVELGPDQPGGWFRNHGPIDSESQVAMVSDLAAQASRLGARVLVIPEYALHADDRPAIRAALEALPQPPLLAIGGTSEVVDHKRPGQRNEAWLLIPDPYTLTHADREYLERSGGYSRGISKLFPAQVASVTEAVTPGDEVPIFFSDRWVIAVLICRDAMSPQLRTSLADVGVNLVLVPAMSDRTASLVGNVTELRTEAQAFVALAIGPTRWDLGGDSGPAPRGHGGRTEAAFDGPYEVDPTPVLCPAPGGQAPPDDELGLWLFDVRTRTASWHAAESADATGSAE